MIKDALVSFWSSEASMAQEDFVGSGFFIAPGKVLTAAHVVDGSRPLWLRPQAGATQAYAVESGKVCKHGSLDVAIVTLPVMPDGAFSLRPWRGNPLSKEIALNGFFEGRLEAPHPFTVLAFDSGVQHYLLDGKQPRGHSGSAACVGGEVWGLAVRHYLDPNIHRGCAIALEQVWDWLMEEVPALQSITPLPEWGEWVGAVRVRLEGCFRAAIFEHLFTMRDGLPDALALALADTRPETLGKRAVEVLITLATGAVKRLVERGKEERAIARRGIQAAMSQAVFLCFDPARLPPRALAADGLAPFVDVEAISAASAALTTCADRSACWKSGKNRLGVPVLHDDRAHEMPLETAEGADRKKALALFAHRVALPSEIPPADIDKATQRDLRAYLRREAKQGRAHLLVIEDELRPEVREDLEAWLQQDLGLSLVVRRDPAGDSAPHYLCDEADLLASIREFVVLLRQPEWNPS